MKSILKKWIMSGKYDEAVSKVLEIGLSGSINDYPGTISDYIVELAFETESISVYSFACALIAASNTEESQYLASEILCQPLCHIEDAYSAALYHARKAAEMTPDDISLKEYLLFFYDIPDKLIDANEAQKIAQEVIEKDPTSQIASQVIEKIGKKKS